MKAVPAVHCIYLCCSLMSSLTKISSMINLQTEIACVYKVAVASFERTTTT